MRVDDNLEESGCRGDSPYQERERRISSLALRYRSGDRAVLGELYAELEPLIRSFLRPHLSAPRSLPIGVEPEDLWQEAHVALAETALEWRPERLDNFVPYFSRSFPWRIDHYLRRQMPPRRTARFQLISVPHDSLMESMEGMVGPDGRDWDDALACSELLSSLPPQYARIVRLHFYHGLSFAEVAEATGISRSAAHEAFGRALSLLRSAIAEPAAPGLDSMTRPSADGRNGADGALLRRCVEVMHRLAPSGSPLPGRDALCRQAGLTVREYRRIMARLDAGGCVVGRRRGSPGSLASGSVDETMRKLEETGHQELRTR